jgi:hypothetical protein
MAELACPAPFAPNYAALMRRGLLRTVLLIATVTVVWLLVAPSQAFAMPRNGAPVCDPRGAITFAPPPQIQDTELSLDIAPDCFELTAIDFRLVKNVDHGRTAPPELSSSQESMTGSAHVVVDLEFSARLPAPSVVERAPQAADRESLERPPRR